MKDVRLLAFDADDTLWDNQSHFDKAVDDYCRLLSCYGSIDQMYKELYKTECGNMESLGYGTKAFIISLVENLVRVSDGKAPDQMIQDAVNIGRQILDNPAVPLEGVKETLQALKAKGKYRMVIFTKGDPLEQEAKIARSGLGEFFEDVEIVGNKTALEYGRLCRHNAVKPEEFAMIGNSFKSDIAPALAIGCTAVHIPFHLTWELEQTQVFDHPHLHSITHFAELLQIL